MMDALSWLLLLKRRKRALDEMNHTRKTTSQRLSMMTGDEFYTETLKNSSKSIKYR